MNWFSYFTPIKITHFSSPINKNIKIIKRFGAITLYVDNAEQSGGTITGMWDKTISKIKSQKSKISNCLILGLGGGTLINILNKYYPEIKITVIEIDPVMIKIAKDHFGIKSSLFLKIIRADAFKWVNESKSEKYDLIIFDLYLGTKNPVKASYKTFLRAFKNLLEPNGFILYNRHFQNDQKDFEILQKYCQEIFRTVKLILSYPFSRILILR